MFIAGILVGFLMFIILCCVIYLVAEYNDRAGRKQIRKAYEKGFEDGIIYEQENCNREEA